jgi:coenzyme Q-binding protein COQ10
MSSAAIKKIISCSKKNLIDMVLDIEQYPNFVPWCLEGKIIKKNDTENYIEIKADLKVGKRFINETYSSLVLYSKRKDLITVTNIEGPLKYLKNEWRFKALNNKTQLDFSIDFELNNSFLNIIMKKSFNFGLEKITNAFEQRALKIFK